MGPTQLLIFQGTPFCNIDCNYCYLPDRLDKTRISFEVISKTIERMLDANLLKEEVTILWHAGEPMVLPISFYEEVFHLIRAKIPKEIRVIQNIQTNLTMVNQEWCDFIKKYHVDLGISIDGPEEIHDMNRITRKGKGTFKQVVKGIELLKKNNIPIRIVSVLTKYAAMFPVDIYKFFSEIGVDYWGINIDEIEADNHKSSYLINDDNYELIYSFFSIIQKLNLDNKKPIVIRELRDAQSKVKKAPIVNIDVYRPESTLLNPFDILTVGTKGDFSTFCPELLTVKNTEKYGDLALGNVFDDSFEDVIKSRKYNLILGDIEAGIEMCRNNCEYFGLCPGGAPANKLGEYGTFAAAETLFCHFTKKIPIDVVIEHAFKEIATIEELELSY